MSKLHLSCYRRGGRRKEGEGKKEGRKVKQQGCFSSMRLTLTHIIELVDGFLDSCDVIGQGNHPIFNIINQFDGL